MKVFSITRIAFLVVLLVIAYHSSPSQQIQWKDINGISGAQYLCEGSGGRLYAIDPGAYARYLISDNDGVDWFPGPIELGEISEMVTKGDTILQSRYLPLSYYNRVLLSTDAGTTWRMILMTPSAYGNFMISSDGSIIAFHSKPFSSASLSRFNDTSFVDFGAPYYTTAGLVAWIDHLNRFIVEEYGNNKLRMASNDGLQVNTILQGQVHAVAFDSTNALFVGLDPVFKGSQIVIDGSVMRTADSGQTWDRLGLTNQEFNSLCIEPTETIFAATRKGVFRLPAGDSVWDDVTPKEGNYDVVFMARSGTILAGNSTYGALGLGGVPTVFRSTDGGETWSADGPRLFDVFAVTVTDQGTIIAGTLGDRTFRTTNAGQSWHQTTPGAIADDVFDLASIGTLNYAGTERGLYSSADDGVTWTNISGSSISGSVYAVVAGTEGILFVGTNFGVYTTTNRGTTWRQAGLNSSTVHFMAGGGTGLLYAVADGEVYSSSDAGGSWISRGLVRDDIQTIVVDAAGNVFVGVYGGLLVSTDGGGNWNLRTFTNSYVYSIACNGMANMVAGTYSGVYTSRDGGNNWTFAGLNGQVVLSLDYDAQQLLIAGVYRGGVYQSSGPVTSVVEGGRGLPSTTGLLQNYPNPFNPSTQISYSIPKQSNIVLRIYDVLGREMATLVNEKKPAGEYTIDWNAASLPSGVYFYRLVAGDPSAGSGPRAESRGFVQTRKMILMR